MVCFSEDFHTYFSNSVRSCLHNALIIAVNPDRSSLTFFFSPMKCGGLCAAPGIDPGSSKVHSFFRSVLQMSPKMPSKLLLTPFWLNLEQFWETFGALLEHFGTNFVYFGPTEKNTREKLVHNHVSCRKAWTNL